jgi:hypothetical protein
MAKNYFAELERNWRHNKKTSVLKEIFGPYPSILQRAKSLRGPDLVQELQRLSAITKDARFDGALLALIEHRIIDGKTSNFLPQEMPSPMHTQRLEAMLCAGVHMAKSYGLSLRHACAITAAEMGWPATSFAAATKAVELIYRRRLAEYRRLALKTIKFPDFLKKLMTPAEAAAIEKMEKSGSTDLEGPRAEKLEKSCSTSIPTTADN